MFKQKTKNNISHRPASFSKSQRGKSCIFLFLVMHLFVFIVASANALETLQVKLNKLEVKSPKN